MELNPERPMQCLLSRCLLFLGAGAMAGAASGISVVMAPLNLICTPLFFGVATTCVLHSRQTPLRRWQQLVLIGNSLLAFFCATAGSLLAIRFTGFDNGISGGMRYSAIGGGIGGFLISLGLLVIVEDSKPLASLPVMSLAGAIFGALFAFVAMTLTELPVCGVPVDDVVSFAIWQGGVAMTIPLFRSSPVR